MKKVEQNNNTKIFIKSAANYFVFGLTVFTWYYQFQLMRSPVIDTWWLIYEVEKYPESLKRKLFNRN